MGMTNASLAVVSAGLGTTFYTALGTDDTVFAKAQTALVAETSASGLARAASTVAVTTTSQANDTVQCSKTFTAGASATIKECGIFTASGGPTMMARAVLSTARSLVANDQYTNIFKMIASA